MKRTTFFLLLLLAGISRGATYYVASNAPAGGDGSATDPFKTLAECDAVLDSGDTLRIWQGSVFREDLSINDLSNVTVTAWGDGTEAMPIMYGDTIISGAQWDVNETYPNVYQYSTTQTIAEAYLSVFEDGLKLLYVSSVSDCNDTAGTFTVDGNDIANNATGPGAVTFYVHPTDGGNPATNGSEYSITDPTRLGALSMGLNGGSAGQGNSAYYIAAGRPAGANGSIMAGRNARIIGCVAFQGSKHEMLINGILYDKCIVWHDIYDSRTNNISMEFYDANGVGYSPSYVDCVALGPGHDADRGTANATAFGGHNAGAGTYYDTSSMTDCAAYGWSAFGGLSASGNVVLTRCWMELCRAGFTARSLDQTLFVIDPWIRIGTESILNDWMISTTGNLTVSGLRCLVQNNGSGAPQICRIADTSDLTLSVTNSSIFANSGTTSCVGFNFGGGPATSLVFRQNIWCVTPASKVITVLTALASTYDVNDNVYWEPGTARLDFDVPATDSTVAGVLNWRAKALAMDPNQEVGSYGNTQDPNFADPENGDWTPGNATVVALGAGVTNPTLEYTQVPSLETILQFEWEGSTAFYDPLNYPNESNVRRGVSYGGDNGTLYQGVLALPAPDDVLAGVTYGAGREYTGTLVPGTTSEGPPAWQKSDTSITRWRKR